MRSVCQSRGCSELGFGLLQGCCVVGVLDVAQRLPALNPSTVKIERNSFSSVSSYFSNSSQRNDMEKMNGSRSHAAAAWVEDDSNTQSHIHAAGTLTRHCHLRTSVRRPIKTFLAAIVSAAVSYVGAKAAVVMAIPTIMEVEYCVLYADRKPCCLQQPYFRKACLGSTPCRASKKVC
ncbi:hypothetical protein GLAREA_05274 [Glarea lozoyensis ATCC 20868]|uniref:Uncharacterized protein n=1 Tax=Glarea lozoyensis (strain ATCC 20868 / MF5171) TaxID=1116229 RepID=S3DVG7_GLAL2|nr:uncharacterized protein GLAREA_05274 [Glarea lozoyensis ATCC 20868]EPE35936.1 hypothetical protein GLAREA_05274 [Glarea lozoyensis ATCC 20868]